MNQKYFYAGIAGFVSAIFLYSFFRIGFSFAVCISVISLVILSYQKFLAHDMREQSRIGLIAIFLICFSLGAIRYDIKDARNPDQNLENGIGRAVSVEAIISEAPSISEKSQTLTVSLRNLRHASSSIPVSGTAIAITDLSKEFHYGDLVEIYGILKHPENFTSGSSSQPFDYVSYLAKDDIFYTIDFAKVVTEKSGLGNPIKSLLYEIKDSFVRHIEALIAKPESSLLAGILIGDTRGMSKDLSQMFRIAGLSHIVVLSGYNISVISEAIMKTLSFLPNMFSSVLGAFGILLFIIMSGASSTAIRAGIMAFIVILGNLTRREYSAGRALLVAALLMLIWNPKILVFDISFQLSFLATFAIIYVSPIFKEKFSWLTEKFHIRETISATLAAQLLVLPLILYKMGLFSFVALPTNILVVPIIPATMLVGFIAAAVSFVSAGLAIPFAWIAWLFLAYIIQISQFFAGLPFSSAIISWFNPAWMITAYLLMGAWLLFEIETKKKKDA